MKWTVPSGLTIAFHASAAFWFSRLATRRLAAGLHLFYRHKTAGWTKPWGGWNDVDAGR